MSITPELVRELLHYDPETGVFVWRERGKHYFKTSSAWLAWNRRDAGKRAGSIWTSPGQGYQCRYIKMLGKHYRENRLAWLYMTDEPLPEEIDHINRDGRDNRWCNLRASTRSDNGRNQSRHRTNTSGVTGVSWQKNAGKWRARCKLDGKTHYLGMYLDLDDAAAAVEKFRRSHGFDAGHGSKLANYIA